MNGVEDPQGGPPPNVAPKQDYKLLVDPCLVKAPQKIFRFNGIIPNDPTCPPVIVKDPRSKAIRLRQRGQIELYVTR